MNIQQTIRQEIKQIKIMRVDRKTPVKQNAEYKDYELAFLVRELTYHKVIAFDAKQKMSFQEDQIKRFLTDILHQSSNQIPYLTTSVLRYDMNGDGIVEYDELINFCTEQYLGEMTVQKLHKQKKYARGAQRIMSQDEFIQTMKIGLSVIDFKPNAQYLQDKFSIIDANQDGYISYEEYFQFLKDYFGTKSYAAKFVNKNSIIEVMNDEKERKGSKELDIIKKYSKFQKNIKIDNIRHVDSVVKFMSESVSPPFTNRGSQSVNKTSYNFNENIYNSPRTTNSINFNANNSSLANYQKSPSNVQIQRRKKPLQSSKIQITLLQKKQLSKDSKFLVPLTAHEASIGERIAKMVFTQLKAGVLASDSNKDCLLTCDQIWNYLKRILQLSQNSQAQIFKRNGMSRQKHFSLEEALRIIISEDIIKAFKQMDGDENRNISLSEFTTVFQKICKIVAYTPLMERYSNLYRSRTEKDSNMTVSDANALISYIFASYPLKK